MPTSQFPFTTGSILVPASQDRRSEAGYLVAATIAPETTIPTTDLPWTTIRVVSYDNPNPIIVCTLAAGYIGGHSNLFWTGRIPLEPNFAIQASANAIATYNFRLSFLVDRN